MNATDAVDGRRILVIDDDEAMRDAFELALEDEACQVETADRGEVGLQKFAAKHHDLVFLDLRMPGIDGFETLRRLRKMDGRTPVFIVTAYHSEYLDALEALSTSPLKYELIGKPISADTIRAVVRRVFGQAEPVSWRGPASRSGAVLPNAPATGKRSASW